MERSSPPLPPTSSPSPSPSPVPSLSTPSSAVIYYMSHLMTAVVLERLHAGRSLLGKHNLQLSQEVDISRSLPLRESTLRHIASLQPHRARSQPFFSISRNSSLTMIGDLTDLNEYLSSDIIVQNSTLSPEIASTSSPTGNLDDSREMRDLELLRMSISQLVASDADHDKGDNSMFKPTFSPIPHSDSSPSSPSQTFSRQEVGQVQSRLNAVGRASQVVENVLRGLYSWWYGTPATATSSKQEDSDSDTISFLGIHHNWLWKQQLRIIRLTPTDFERVHPYNMTVRATYPYSSIESITLSDISLAIIHLQDQSAEYYLLVDRDKLVDELCQRAGRRIPVVEVLPSS